MIDPVAFHFGSLVVRWYGIILSSAILIGVLFTLKEARRQDIDVNFFLDFFIYGIPGAVLGARLYYVIFRWDLYRGHWWKILATRQGGLAIHGAIIAGLLTLFWLSRRRDVSFWKALDITAPALILGQAIGRWGNFINQEAHGSVVSREFISHFPEFIQRQMYIRGHYYHPTFLYESLWDVSIFLFLLYIRRRNFIKPGDVFIIYAVGYSLGRFFIEGMRTDSLMLGPFRVAQLVSLIMITAGAVILFIRHRSGAQW